MNFKTTLILLVLLLGLGAYIFFSGKGDSTAMKTETKETGERKLFEVKAEDITKVAVAPASGNRLVLQKDGAKWRIAEPVSAEAESFEVDNLTRTIADLKAHGVADAGDAATGLS